MTCTSEAELKAAKFHIGLNLGFSLFEFFTSRKILTLDPQFILNLNEGLYSQKLAKMLVLVAQLQSSDSLLDSQLNQAMSLKSNLGSIHIWHQILG